MTIATNASTITDHEAAQVERAFEQGPLGFMKSTEMYCRRHCRVKRVVPGERPSTRDSAHDPR